MVHWSRVRGGFDAEDETLNFGARTVAENDGSIYETSTRATIQCDNPDELVNRVPTVRAAFCRSLLCIAVDNSITIFSDETCIETVTSIGFESPVTAHCVSPGGEQLFAAVDKGVVHGFDLSCGSQQILCVDLYEKFGCNEIINIQLRENKLLAVASTGQIFEISEFSGDINDTLSNAKIELLVNNKKQVTTAVYHEEGEGSRACLLTLGEEMFLWPEGRRTLVNFRYIKAQFFHDYAAILCLRNDGHLDIVCRQTLLRRKIFTGPIKDFVTIKDQSEGPRILVLMQPKDSKDTTSLYLMDFPSFQIKFSMIVSTDTFLIELSDVVDHLVFIEGNMTLGKLDTLRIKAIEESQLEFRLQRLLRRHKFDEALDFAKKFKLDVEIVFHAEAIMLMEKLRPSAHSRKNVDVFEFIGILDKIKDVIFVYNCCKNAMTKDLEDSKSLVIYARKRIVDFMSSKEYCKEKYGSELEKLLSHVSDVLRKMETFTIVNTKTTQDNEIDEWNRFAVADMLDECMKHLANGELNTASFIWARHITEISPKITPVTLTKIFASIPENLPPTSLWPWLRQFIPSLTSFQPSGLSDILNWAYKRTKSLEIHQRQCWPDVGLSFANGLIKLLKFKEHNVCFQLQQQYSNKNSDLHRLMMLIQAMSDLSELKMKFKIILSLEIYLGDCGEVVHILLMKIHVDDIHRLMDEFLDDYMKNHGLRKDSVLSELVQKILKKSKAWWMTERAPWDKRLVQIIDLIQNTQNKLLQTLEILKRSPVPWSTAINHLVDKSYSYDSPLVDMIRVEAASVNFRLILKKYGFAHIGNSSKLFNHMIRQDDNNIINELLELTKKDIYKQKIVFSKYIDYHLKIGNLDRILHLLELLPKDITNFLTKSLVASLQIRLNLLQTSDEVIENYMEIIEILQEKTHLEVIPILRSIFKLRKEFNISITLNQYLTSKNDIILNFISELIEKGENSLEKVQRIGELLKYPRIHGIMEYYEATGNNEIIGEFFKKIMNSWEILDNEEIKYSSKIMSRLILEVNDDVELARSLKILANRNLTYSTIDYLEDTLKLSNRLNTFGNAVSLPRCPLEDYSNLFPMFKDASISAGDVLIPYLNDLNALCEIYEESMENNVNQDVHIIQKNLWIRTKSLMNEHYDLAVVKILMSTYVRICQLHPKFVDEIDDVRGILNTAMSVLLKKIIENIVFDVHLGLACLLQVPPETALKLLSTCSNVYETDLRRNKIIKELSLEYFKATKNEPMIEKFTSAMLLHHWAKRLVPYGISYKDVLASGHDQRRVISKQIMMLKKDDTLDTLKDFCRDFGFVFTDCCLQYLEILLTTWKPQFQVSPPQEGPTTIKLDQDNINSLTLECKRVASEITDKNALNAFLSTALSTPLMNFYHYEVFLIALDLAQFQNRDTWRWHLCFLQTYTRIAQPTETELDAWLHWSQEQELPLIAKWRLPFLLKDDFFKVIKPELNLKTYEKWLGIGPTLKMQIGTICTLAVRNTADLLLKNTKPNKNGWDINSRNPTLLKDIKKCFEFIPGIDKLQYATASLYWLANWRIQPGADLVAVYRECLGYMQEWLRLCPEDADPGNKFGKIKDKYRQSMSKHFLYSYGLGIEKYLALVDNPKKLIIELFNDESIPMRYKSATKITPDINGVVDQLGAFLELDLPQIRNSLLMEWLQPEPETRINDSIIAVFHQEITSNETDIFGTDDNLLRACYIAGSGDIDNNLDLLVHVAYDREEKFNPGMRFRALRVIESLTDEVTLEKYTRKSAKEFKQYMRSLQYLTELQRLGIGYSVTGFEECSKQKLVQVLVNTQYCVSRALILIPQLFLDYNLEDFDLLNLTLQRMIKLSLINEIRTTLMCLGNIDRLINYSGYISAWQFVITDAFMKLEGRAGDEIIEQCEEALRMLHSCPVIDKIDFCEIIDNCLRSGMIYFAVALLPFLRDDERFRVVGEVRNFEEIIGKLEELGQRGILVVNQSVVILECLMRDFSKDRGNLIGKQEF